MMGLPGGELSTHRLCQQHQSEKCHQIPLPWHCRASVKHCVIEADGELLAKEVENKLEKVHM